MAVTLDAQSTADTLVTSTNIANHGNLTVGASLSNSAMVIAIASAGTATVTAVTWDTAAGTPQSAAIIGATTVGATRVELWGLINPNSGNKNLRVNWSLNVNDGYVSAVSFTGVNQSGGLSSFKNYLNGSGTNNTVTLGITSATGDAVVGTLIALLNAITTTSGTNIFIDNGGSVSSAASMWTAGAATVTLTSNSPNTWNMSGCDVVAASGVTDTLMAQTWL